MKRFRPLLLLALLAGPTSGQPPDAADRRGPTVKLVGPSKAQPGGRMVIVQAATDPSSFPDDLLSIKYNWTVLVDGKPETSFLTWPDGSRIVIASSEATSLTTVVLDVDCLLGRRTEIEGREPTYSGVELVSQELLTHVIAVGRAAPEPNPPSPGPTPGPVPEPDIDVGLAPFAKEVAAMVRQAVAADPRRSARAKAVGDVYAGVAGKISRAAALNPVPADLAAYGTAEGIVRATGAELVVALGPDRAAWSPFFTALRGRLGAMADAGQLPSAGAHAPVFNDIAAGLRSIR